MSDLKSSPFDYSSLTSQSAIEELFFSFIEVLATAIDERTPYNASHTRNVVRYTGKLIDYLNQTCPFGQQEYFDDNRKQQLIIGAWLHDIGKLLTPLEILDKSTRLGNHLVIVLDRLTLILALAEKEYWKKIALGDGDPTEETIKIKNLQVEIAQTKELIKTVNNCSVLNPTAKEKFEQISQKTFYHPEEKTKHWLTEEELSCLMISTGTLNKQERQIMNNHVLNTDILLSKMKFSQHFINVPKWAIHHHEFLDGSGYPLGLKANDLPLECRILTVLDIFEALTAKDRPYKSGISIRNAFQILYNMVEEGKLDYTVVSSLEASKIWE